MRIALGIEYDGSDFRGWQKQQNRRAGLRTVQACLEAALSTVAAHPVETVCAGRTDAKVHASAQVVHFDTQAERSLRAWVLGANSNLPGDVSVRWACAVPAQFHARFSARARRYRYTIFNRATRCALYRNNATWHRYPLDEKLMRRAGQALLGEHDFSAYRSKECQAKSPLRSVYALSVARDGDWVVLDIEANAFLHHMVRNIAGVLMAIGRGEQPVDWAKQVLQSRDRTRGGVTAPPDGLYLLHVRYPKAFGLPVPEHNGFELTW